jgi:cytochrome c oxidase cbb3-type subunit 3
MTFKLLAVAGAALCLLGCQREARQFQALPAAANRETAVRLTSLQAGSPQQQAPVTSPYQNDAWGISEGKRLYAAYNCSGCHALNGGGAIGPPLMDDKWIYGSQPDQIFSTIAEGRPDGMPSFGGHIPQQQIWQLVAYVEAMSGQVAGTIAPGRNDDLMSAIPPSRTPPQVPVQVGHR